MVKRNLLIVSRNELFKEGLLRLLKTLPGISVIGAVGSLEEVHALEDERKPDVIVMNREGELGADARSLSELLNMTRSQVLTFTLEDRDMVIYSRKQVVDASIEDLVEELKEFE